MCPYVSEAQDNAVSSRIPVPASASLPRLPTSNKYKAPEPPSATRQGSLASKLKVGIVLLADFSKRHKAEDCDKLARCGCNITNIIFT